MSDFIDFVLTVVGWLSLPLLALSAWLLARSVKRVTRLRVRALVLPLVTTVLVPIVYVSILQTEPPRLLSAALFAVGVTVGIVWANTTSLALHEGEVFGRRSIGYLIVWGATFILSQTLALASTPEALAYGLSTVYLSMGIAIGTNTNLLVRRGRVRSGTPDAPIGPAIGRRAVA